MLHTLHDLTAGLLAGLFSVFLVLYAFQPTRPYPSWILEPAEQPWIFVLFMIVLVYLFRWDYMVGVLGLLCLLAVVLDLVVFTASDASFVPAISLIPIQKAESFGNEVIPEVSKKWTVNEKPTPQDLMRNREVDPNRQADLGLYAGTPLSSLSEPNVQEASYYPLFS